MCSNSPKALAPAFQQHVIVYAKVCCLVVGCSYQVDSSEILAFRKK